MNENQDKTFAEQVDAVLSGADMNISHLEVLKVTPLLLRMVGVPNLPILMTAKHVKTITQESGSDSANYHGLGIDLIKKLPELISDPVMIMDSISPYEKARKSIVVVTQTVDKENRPVIGAIKIAGFGNDSNGFEISANILTSAYGKDSFKTFIERNISQGAVLYADKTKSQALFKTPGLQLPDNFNSLDFDIIIRKTNAFVNRDEQKSSEKSKRSPLLINLFAGPSAGKTTAALELTAALKKKGFNVEYVSEYAKELVLENKTELLKNQVHVTDEQFHRLDRLRNSGVEIIVTDSPVLLGKVYGEGKISREYGEKLLTYHNSFDNFNLFVNRGSIFQTEGRVHNLEQSKELDAKILAMLQDNRIFYGNYNHDEIDKTVERITTTFSRLNKLEETTEKNEGSMTADTNNANAQSARERVLKVRDDMVKTLLAHIEKNPTDWQSGWNNIAAGAPYNGKTSTAYRGLNALYLAFLGASKGYKDTRWVTFNQAKELGASVKKGEKSAPVIFFEFYDRKTKKAFDNRTVKDMTEEEKTAYLKENVYAVMKYSSVFNAEQCHNFPERKEIAMSEEEMANQNAKIETIIANSSAPVRYDGGSRAYYSPGTDSIHLPVIAAFDTMQDYYATALHEIAHSTGHESRLNRDLAGGFGSESYAKEELRAELACVFMQMEQGIQLNGKHITNHAAYLNSWLQAAKSDTSVFFKAAADAQKIADYVADNYLQAADSAVIKEENVDQEQPERNPMADYLRAETEKRAEEIRTVERLRAENEVSGDALHQNVKEWYTSAYPNDEAGESIKETLNFAGLENIIFTKSPAEVYEVLGADSIVRERAFTKLSEIRDVSYDAIYTAWMERIEDIKSLSSARAEAKRLAMETGEPYVTVEWVGTSNGFPDIKAYDVMSLSEADKKLNMLDAQADKNDGYFSTKLHIDMVFQGKPDSYECRFDIGNEHGGLVHHIDRYLKNEKFFTVEDQEEANALRKYFKLHVDLSAIVDKAIAAELPLQEQYDVQSYVLAARGAVNSAVPFSTYKLPETSAFAQEEDTVTHRFLNKTKYGSPVSGIIETKSGNHIAIINNNEQKEVDFPDGYPSGYLIAHDYNPDTGEFSTAAYGFVSHEEAREYCVEHYEIDVGESTAAQGLKQNIKEWYSRAYPNDSAGQDIHPEATFQDLQDEVNRSDVNAVYGMLGEDSIIRERAFLHLAAVTESSYDDIYSAFSGETPAQKLANARAQARRLAAETGEPYVTIEWSEGSDSFPGLKENEVMSLSEADKRLTALDSQADREEGYYKTKLHIDFVFEGKPESYENCRFDIGSENGGLVHHIDEYLKNDLFQSADDRAEADALREYFKRHLEVSEYLLNPETLAELSEEEQGDVNMYISRSRDVLNNSEPFSDYYYHMPLTPEEIKKGREAAHAAGLPFYEGNDEDFEAFEDAGGYVYDGNMSVEDYKRMWELREQDAETENAEVPGEEQATDINQRYYYPINEESARRAREANSFSDYKEGSATSSYRSQVDRAITIAEEQKKLVDSSYHDKIEGLLNSYAKRLADNINKGNEIDARVPSILISGGGNFPVRKKQKQNAARDRNYQEWQEIQGILDNIRNIGKGGISSDDPNSIQKLTTKLESLEKSQETMKAVNAYYRKNKTLDGCPELTAEQIAELKADMNRFPHLEGKPYPTWALSNNNAEIRRVKERIEELSKRQEVGFVGWEFNGGEVRANTSDNRLQIFFEEKPDEETRSDLKHNGFKWSPKANAWQRQLTANAYYAADRINAIQPISGEKPTALQRAHDRQHNADVDENSVQNDINQEQEKLIDDAAHWYSMERPQSKFQDCLDAVREMDAETIREYAEQYRAYLDYAAEFINDESERTNYNYSASDLFKAWRENAQTEETTKEKLTVEQARNAMLDAQEQRQNHYAVRIEDVPYTDPEDGYEGTEPAQVIYIISEHGNVREWKTIPLDSDVFSSDLPNGSLVSYEPIEYEELEEIAKKVKEPIQTYKDVLRAELEVDTERHRSEAYYDQRVDDILNEHYRTEYGLFERNIENPKYLSGMLYAEENFRGERVVSLTQNESRKNIAIIAQANGQYAVAEDYHTDDGRNWGKYHLFDNQESAEEFRTKNFPSIAERANRYQALAASKSPLGQEYARIKGENADSVVFYRVGDFYEVLGADAERVAEKLELTLTGRTIGTEERVPMCGVPYHAIDQYADTLAKKGENVIIADGTDIKAYKAKVDLIEKRLRDYADTLRRNDLEVGNTAQTDEYYLSQAREQIAAYERSDEYRQALREDFPTDFIDDTPQDMAEITQNKPVEAQEQKREWLSIELPEGAATTRYGENVMIKMPKGEFSNYALFVPSRFVQKEGDKRIFKAASDYTFRLTNDGRQVELTGQELKDRFAGKHIDKTYRRVVPSRAYLKAYENLEQNIPAELRALPTWCCYRTRWNDEKGKKDKFLISAIDGKFASSKEPERWVSFDAALKYARENNCAGVSLLLSKEYGITCIDLDKCVIDANTGELKERASKLVNELKGTYIERSTSGNGIHIFLKDDILKSGTYNSTSTDKQKGDLEVFDEKHIISMTGDMLSETNALTRAGSAATVYLRQELGERRNYSSTPRQVTNSGSVSDNELISRIKSSKVAAKFNDLYSGRGISGDRSKDDAQLAHLLLYFSGGDKEQTFRIMRESGLYRPDKPDSYYRGTIEKINAGINGYAKRPNSASVGGNSRKNTNNLK